VKTAPRPLGVPSHGIRIFARRQGQLNRTIILGLFAALVAGVIPVKSAAGEQKLTFSGDLRGRFESFWFSEDATGSQRDDRHRIRYRLRVNAKATLNDRAALALRVGTGPNDSRSGNETLGGDVDFGPNGIAVRYAYLMVSPFADSKLPAGDGHLKFHFGRVPNPYFWKKGQDKMIWDNDIMLAGTSALFDVAMGESAELIVNGGWYQIDENSSGDDPWMGAIQAGITGGTDDVQAGVKGTFHHFSELDSNFVKRGVDGEDGATSGGGNIRDGLTGSPDGGSMQVVHVQGFVSAHPGAVPVTAYGGYAINLDAEASRSYPDVDKEEVAYSGGVEAGDKKEWGKLGVAWFHVEANSFPSQFIDSDYLDGRTNREGLMVYGSRMLLDGVEFGFKLFDSDAIETGSDGLAESVKNSKRTRLQVDLIYHF
jgi:hypothetical protein